MEKIKKGLLETPIEKQKFSFGGIFGYPDLKELPNEYSIGEPLEIKNQNIPLQSYICVAESLCSVSEYQEGVVLEPSFTVKLISEILGNTTWVNEGTDLANGAKASLRGFLERQNSPYSVEKKGVEFCAEPKNWNEIYNQLAKKHSKQAWFWIGTSGKLEMFDAIRAAMWKFKDEKRAIQTGVIWHNEWTGKYISQEGTPAGGHAFTIIGWKGEFLKIQNSVGVNIGDNGIQWIHKDLVNKLFSFGALMFADMPNLTEEEIIAKSEEYRKKKSILEQIISLISKIIEFMKKQIEIKEEPVKDILMDNQKDIKDISNGQQDEILKWDNPQNVRYSIRVICDEYNLSWRQKDLLCDICKCESEFNPNAKLINAPKSVDRGLFQWNSFYFPQITDEMAYNPETNARFAIKALKDKKIKTYWSASQKCWNKDGKYNDLI